MTLDAVKAAVLVTLTAVVQIAFVNAFELAEGRADVLLLVLVGIALLRGPLFGAVAGFWAGLLVDTMTLGTLGLTSLLLTARRVLGRALRRGDVESPEPARAHPHRGHAADDRRRGRLAGRPRLPRRLGFGRNGGRAACSCLRCPQPGARDPRVLGACRQLFPPRASSRAGAGRCLMVVPEPALPPARPAGRGAVPPDAAGGRPHRHPRRRRRRPLRAPLLPALGAAGDLRRSSTSRRRRDNQIRTYRIQPPRGPILDRNGVVLVSNVPGTVVQLWPAYTDGRLDEVIVELSELLGRSGQGHPPPGQSPRATTRSRRSSSRPTSTTTRRATSASTRTTSPGVEVGPDPASPLRAGLAREPRARLRRRDRRAGARAARRGVRGRRPDRQGRDRAGLRHLPARRARDRAGPGQLAQRADERPVQPSQLPKPGYAVRLTIDVELQRAAEEAISYRDRARSRRGATGRRTAAPSWPWTLATARSTRWLRTRPTTHPYSPACRARRSTTASSAEERAGAQLPDAQPRDRRRVPGRLHVQAGHGARRARRRPDHPDRVLPVRRPARDRRADVQELGSVRERGDGR